MSADGAPQVPCSEDPEKWFALPHRMDVPEADAKRLERESLAVCGRDCPAVAFCLDLALSNRERHGVWGAATTPERQTILARTKAPLADARQGVVAARILDRVHPSRRDSVAQVLVKHLARNRPEESSGEGVA